jgi:hypothetical protein
MPCVGWQHASMASIRGLLLAAVAAHCLIAQLTWSSFGGCHGFHLGRISFRSSVLPDAKRWSRDTGVYRHSMGTGTGHHQHGLHDASGALLLPAGYTTACFTAIHTAQRSKGLRLDSCAGEGATLPYKALP